MDYRAFFVMTVIFRWRSGVGVMSFYLQYASDFDMCGS
ncbi:hypothetical protein SALB1_0778 [Salinisphaera sp. LB1]|nr:hypothetical protein SALB1_0778 [Salinisphaera sp. LB1]